VKKNCILFILILSGITSFNAQDSIQLSFASSSEKNYRMKTWLTKKKARISQEFLILRFDYAISKEDKQFFFSCPHTF